jgi:hypothetical protein
MGGSGGSSGYFGSDPERVLRELRATEQNTDQLEYEAECNRELQELLSAFNNRDAEAIARHLESIKGALNDDVEGSVDLRYGGSVAKHTFVDGLSDVDLLVLINKSALAELSPDGVKSYLAKRMLEEFPSAQIATGRLAVTVKFPDAEIQLLPAVRTSQGYHIANARGTEWVPIRPQDFAKALTDVNSRVGGKVVPVVKLAKAIVANLPEQHRVSGYHTEALAVSIFSAYTGPQMIKDMLKHFFTEAANRVQAPIRDKTGQSRHVDDYLGKEGSLERRLVSDAFSRIARRMSNADTGRRVEPWTDLLED